MLHFKNPRRSVRYLAGVVGIVCLAFLMFRLGDSAPPRRPLPPPLLPVPVTDPGIVDLQLTRHISLRLQPSAEPPPEPPPPPPVPAPPTAAPPPLAAPEPQEAHVDSSTTPDIAALEPQALEQPQPVVHDVPTELCLRPRHYVHPSVPERVIRKRKIDDSVRLQSYVGSDGRVLEVRVLHRIPNCDECNESAIAAARGFVYDVPIESGAVWTTPFELHFTYQR